MTAGNPNMTTVPAVGSSPPLLSAALVVAIVALLGWYCLRSDASERGSTPEPPGLRFESPVCSQQGESAETAAKQQMSNAHSQWERAVFDPRLTAKAVRNVRQAAHCFRAVGLKVQARAAENVATEYEREANQDYVRQCLRLKVALGRRDVESARRAIERLRALLENRDSEYLRGLARIERELNANEGAP